MANLKDLLAQEGLMGNSTEIVATVSNGAITPPKLGIITDQVTLDQGGLGGTLRVIAQTKMQISGGYQAALISDQDAGFFLWEGTSNQKLMGTGLVTIRPIGFAPPPSIITNPKLLGARLWVKGNVTTACRLYLFVANNALPQAHFTIPVGTYNTFSHYDLIEDQGTLPWPLGEDDAIFLDFLEGGITSAFLYWQIWLG